MIHTSVKGGRRHERTDCDFEDNAFGELREGKDFSDVTLACEDVQQVEAHKEVLTSSSPFFRGKTLMQLWSVESLQRTQIEGGHVNHQ